LTGFLEGADLMIEQSEIERVKRETDLVRLIEASGVKLKRRGNQLAGLCPFHDDHEPSLINFAEGQISRLYAHTHPFQSLATGASAADRMTIQALGQRSSFLLEHGNITKFTQSSEQVIKRKF
jgi:CHC2-type zinc finger protein